MWRTALLGLTLLLPACQTLKDNTPLDRVTGFVGDWVGEPLYDAADFVGGMVGNPLDGFFGFIGDTHTYHLNPNRPSGDAPNILRAEGRQVGLEPLATEPGNVWPGPIAPDPTLQDIQRRQNEEERTGQAPAPVLTGSSTSPTTRFYPTPGGTAVGTQMGNGVQTYTDPKGGTGIVVPNGNGTSTLLGPDGAVTSVPAPR